MTAASQKIRLRVAGMDCASCATKIENAVSRLPGGTAVQVSVAGGSVAVEHDGAALRDVVCGQIAALGYAITESKELDDIHVRRAAGSVNQPPVANADSGYSTSQNTALTIAASSLLANDTDPNGDPLTVTGVSGAVNGNVSFNAQTNVVTFTPTPAIPARLPSAMPSPMDAAALRRPQPVWR